MAGEVEVTVDIPDEADANDNGVPDVVETGVALERATDAAETADEAEEAAESAAATADVAVEVGIDAHTRIDAVEQAMGAMAATLGSMTETLVSLRDLVAANAQATSTQLEVQMRGNQPSDTPPANSHWLNRRIGA